MKKVKHKRPQDESFPVGKLVKNLYARWFWLIITPPAARTTLPTRKILPGKRNWLSWPKPHAPFTTKKPKDNFVRLPIWASCSKWKSGQHAVLDLLTAFERDAENRQPEIWEQLIDYCKYSAAPVGRFMLAIHDENPSTYLPAETLCAALQIVNHIQDLKEDAVKLRRFYLPAEMMKRHGAENSDIYLSFMTPPLKKVVGEVLENVKGMLKDSEVLPSLISSFRLRAEVGVILSLTNSVVKRLEKGDVLAQRIRPSGWDWVKAWFIGWKTALSGKKRTVRMAK